MSKIIDWSEVLYKSEDEEGEGKDVICSRSPRRGECKALHNSLCKSEHEPPTERSEVTTAPLGAGVENHAYVLITLQHPRTKKFLKADSKEQKAMLYRILWNSKNFNGLRPELDSTYVFEHCKSGQIHLHAMLHYIVKCNFHIIGFISDIVKNFINNMPLCTIQFKEGFMFTKYQRYKSPPICVQYKSDTEDPEYKEFWEKHYMNKENTSRNL